MNTLGILGRNSPLFENDIRAHENTLSELVQSSKFLVIGGAGSVGQAITREIFLRNPKLLHVVDISENNLVELVRDIRSTIGYIDGEFRTFAIDCGGIEFEALLQSGVSYDYIVNLSALKHVRSEKDPYTLMRMIEVNILNTEKSLDAAIAMGAKKYFCVSTDKAANPANVMGATKKAMELLVMEKSSSISVSSARFANVAFSDGSLLKGFQNRFEKRQPMSAPNDISRYFITQKESGELCLLSCLLAENREIYFPNSDAELGLIKFSEIAERWLKDKGFEPYIIQTEEEARSLCEELIEQKKWPCYFFSSQTSGEKPSEEFFTAGESLDFDRYDSIGVICNKPNEEYSQLRGFLEDLLLLRKSRSWTRENLIDLLVELIPEFDHIDKGKNLDEQM